MSGFLIGGILIDELFSSHLDSIDGVGSFWKRRWFRTLPNFYLFLIITILQERLVSGKFPDGAGKFFWFGQACLYPDPDFFAGAWSLAIEEWFYLLFPLTIFVLARFLKNRSALLSVIVIFIVVPVVFRFFLPATTYWDPGVRRITLPRLDSITYGVILAFLKKFHADAWRFLSRLWPLGLVAVLSLSCHFCHHAVTYGYFSSESIFYRVFYFCVLAFVLMLAFPGIAELAEPDGRWKVIVQKISLWSYSIYLCHPVVIGCVDVALKHLGAGYFQAHIERCVLAWLICIPLSGLIYRLYERPLMNLRDKPFRSILFKAPAKAAIEQRAQSSN